MPRTKVHYCKSFQGPPDNGAPIPICRTESDGSGIRFNLVMVDWAEVPKIIAWLQDAYDNSRD